MNKIKELTKSSFEITYELFIVMIPTLIVVKILDEIGFVEILNKMFAPLMFLLGLPEAISLVFTTSMLTSPYAGLIVFSGLPADMPFTAAQASVLGLLILFTHSLPIEVIICRKAGVRARAMIFIRLGLGILSCYFLNLFFELTGYMNYPATILLPSLESAPDLLSWGISQLKGLGMILIIIVALVIILDFLKYIGVEKLIEKALKPFQRLDSSRNQNIAGSGLGLSISQDIIKTLDGNLNLSKSEMGGLKVKINLPKIS